ncbi:tetratricopeptide repeat-containing sensor histidine kinase [Flavobacterium chilense]|uniref:histidine kinase n=1 Tax=Flavobacterium chilense TaxID=946677 RepID=A0A1M7G111_9FLAO|nr:tetratricopeptide repeat protein [Flavobacterium chilense]SHM10054.1 Tetratricopeptide repeat-containing protein [Flavobacterium chilense]
MKRPLYFFHNKVLLKYLIILLLLLLGSALFLFNFYKSENLLKKDKKDASYEINRLTDIGDVFYDHFQYDSAFYYYNKAQLICDPKINSTEYVYTLSSIAELQQEQGNYIASEATVTETLPYLKYIKDPKYSWNIYNTQGINYTNNEDYNNAIRYFRKAIQLKVSSWRKSMSLNNLAVAYIHQKEYKKAQQLLEILASQKNISKFDAENNIEYAYTIDNLGYCYYKLGDSRALNSFNEGLKIRAQLKSTDGLTANYIHLSFFFQKNNPVLAKDYALKGYETARKIKSVSGQINTLNLVIKSSEGNVLKKHILRYIHLIDSSDNARKKTKNQFADIKYAFNKDKEENLQLRAQKAQNELKLERQTTQTIICYIIIACIIILITSLCFYLISKSEKEKKEAVYKSEIRISKKLHDELANDVYQTLTLAKNKDLGVNENKEQLLNNLQIIYSRTRNISKENSEIPTNENYIIALKDLISGFQTQNNTTILNGIESISWNKIDKNKKITIYRIIQELLVNMKKHSEANLVIIAFRKTDKTVIINYTDNGKGIDLTYFAFRSGLQNIEYRILAIKGSVDISSAIGKGFKVFIEFPV